MNTSRLAPAGTGWCRQRHGIVRQDPDAGVLYDGWDDDHVLVASDVKPMPGLAG